MHIRYIQNILRRKGMCCVAEEWRCQKNVLYTNKSATAVSSWVLLCITVLGRYSSGAFPYPTTHLKISGCMYIVSLGQCWWLFRERITRWPRERHAAHDCASTMWLHCHCRGRLQVHNCNGSDAAAHHQHTATVRIGHIATFFLYTRQATPFSSKQTEIQLFVKS